MGVFFGAVPEGEVEAVEGELGEFLGGEVEVLGEGGVFFVEGVAEHEGVVGIDRAGDALVEELADGVVAHGGDAGDLEFEVGDGTDVEADVVRFEEVDDGGVFDRADAVFDALGAEFADTAFDEMGGHEFAGVSFDELTGVAGAVPDAGGPGFEGEVFGAVEIDPSELGPVDTVVDDGCSERVVAVVSHPDEDADFEPGGRGGENGVDDLGSMHPWLGEDADMEAALDVVTILLGAGFKDDLGAFVKGFWGGEDGLGDLGEELSEVGEAVVAEGVVPHVGWLAEELRGVAVEKFDGARAFEVEVGLGLGEALDEGGEIWAGLIHGGTGAWIGKGGPLCLGEERWEQDKGDRGFKGVGGWGAG